MAMQLSDEQKAAYSRDGIIHIKGAVDAGWIERMLHAVNRVTTDPDTGLDRDSGGLARRLYVDDPEFRAFAFETDLACLAAQALQSEDARLYFDQIFVKRPEVDSAFPWHQDHPFWPIRGTQVCSTWVALTSASVESSALEFVRGSHRWGATYRPYLGDGKGREYMNKLWDNFGDLAMSFTDQIEDFENHPDRYEILGYQVEPGDALLFDYQILHRSRANTSQARRVAVSWRWLGDDAYWAPIAGADPIVSQADTFLSAGERITDDDAFPLVYTAKRQ
jgi:ectoine hydroxylase-related dioxygenase (phytanoyl-CoA dioxygenase family)